MASTVTWRLYSLLQSCLARPIIIAHLVRPPLLRLFEAQHRKKKKKKKKTRVRFHGAREKKKNDQIRHRYNKGNKTEQTKKKEKSYKQRNTTTTTAKTRTGYHLLSYLLIKVTQPGEGHFFVIELPALSPHRYHPRTHVCYPPVPRPPRRPTDTGVCYRLPRVYGKS